MRLIPVEQVAYLRSDEKYTLVVWDGGEALIRKTIRELADELDPERFAQIHRSVIVNLHQVAQVHRGLNETAEVAAEGPQATCCRSAAASCTCSGRCDRGRRGDRPKPIPIRPVLSLLLAHGGADCLGFAGKRSVCGGS